MKNISNAARRRLLKSLAIGGAVIAGKNLPAGWSRPVVDAVVLPAHAQASCLAVDDTYDLNPGSPNGSVPAPGVLINDVATSVVSNTAAVLVQGGPVNTLTVNSDGSFTYSVNTPDTIFTFTYTTDCGATATVTVNHDIGFVDG